MTEEESGRLNKLSGRRRRTQAAQVKKWRELRKELKEGGREYELYLYNHMDQPTPPYIFGTIFNVEDKPIGETSLLEQANPLQEAIDRRKRQFDDNADLMNGVMKVDTKHAKITEAQAKRFKANPKGIWYGEGVGPGVTRETGKELPSFLFNDLEHSIRELDNLFGTQPTFRGEKGATETATGRAILREQSYQRLNELIDLMDSLHEQLYNWWFQLMKVRYTDTHLVKPMGAPKAVETISLTQDDLQEGIEIKIIPGQIMPEDRLYRAERATEAAKDGLIDPLTYFEATDWDNPMEQAKRIEMYKLNPFSVIELTDEDLEKLQRAMQMMGGPPGAGGGEGGDPRAQAVAQLRQRAQELINSPDFQKLPPDEQKAALSQLRNQLAGVTGAQ